MSRSFGRGGRGGNGGRGRNRGHVSGTGSSNVVPFLPHLRIEHVLKLYPVSEESWFNGVASGRYPKPHKIGGLEVWRRADIIALCDWFAGKLEKYPVFPVGDRDTGELPLLDPEFDF